MKCIYLKRKCLIQKLIYKFYTLIKLLYKVVDRNNCSNSSVLYIGKLILDSQHFVSNKTNKNKALYGFRQFSRKPTRKMKINVEE